MDSFKEFLKESKRKIKDKHELKKWILDGNDPNDVDYSHITDISFMFRECSNLKTIPLKYKHYVHLHIY